MAIRGENIGTAYVRILADGSGLDRSIRDQFKDHDATFKDEGEKAAAKWEEGWKEEFAKRPTREKMRDGITKALGRGKWLEDGFFNKGPWQEFEKRLEREYGEAGRRAAEKLRLETHKGMDLGRLAARMELVLPDVLSMQEQIDREWLQEIDRAHGEAITINKQFNETMARQAQKAREDEDRRLEAHWADLAQKARDAADNELKIRLDLDRELEMHWRKLERVAEVNAAHESALNEDRRRSISKLKTEYSGLMRLIERMAKADEINKDNRQGLVDDLRRVQLEMGKFDLVTHDVNLRLQENDRRLHENHSSLGQWIKRMNTVSEVVGKSFGKGSRNNFLNFIGSVTEGLAKMALKFPLQMFQRVVNYGQKFAQVWGEEGSVKAFRMLERTMLKGLGSITAGLGGLFIVLGPLVSLISQVLGGLVALSGSIGMGAVGAMGALAGAVLPAAAGLGVLIIGMKNLDGESKKSAKGIIDAFKGLGKAAGEGLMFDRKKFADDHHHVVHSFADTLDTIKGMVTDLGPVTRKIGRGMADAMDIFTERMGNDAKNSTGAWDKFITAMTGSKKELGFLGVESKKVGRIFGESFGGLLGTLRSLMPLTDRFLTWLRDLTVRYDDWINSKAGQEQMVDFFDRAGDSASKLGGFLKAAGKLLGTLIDTGSKEGDGLFQSMTDQLNEWNDQLKADGGRGLRQWFSDSAETMRDLGDILKGIGSLFGDLDTEASRGLMNHALKLLADVLETIDSLLGPVASGFNKLSEATGGFSDKLAAAALVFPRLNSAFASSSGKMSTFVSNMKGSETRMIALKSAARGAAGIAGLGLLTAGATTSNKKLSVLFDTLGGAATGFALGGPIGALIGGAGGGLLGIVSAAKKADDAATNMKAHWEGLRDTLDEVTGATTAATRAYVYDELQRSKTFEVLDKEGISRRTVVDAILGQKSAQQKLNAIMDGEQTRLDGLNTKMAELKNQRDAANAVSGAGYGTASNNRKAAIDAEIEATQKQIDSQKNLIDSINKGTGAVQEDTRAMRIRSKAVTDLSELVGKIPKDKLTKIKVDGILPTTRGIAQVAKKYNLLPKQVKSIINVLHADTSQKAVQRVIDKLKEAGKQHPKPGVDADTGDGTKKINTFMDLINALPGVGRKQNATAKLLADATSANREVDKTKTNLHTLISGDYSAKIKADTSSANFSIDNLNSRLANIRDQTVYVDVYTREHGGKGGGMATGGIVNYAQRRLIGEAGAEAVVPLNRPLGQVDPAVRWLSAIAQGKTAMASGGVVGGGRTVDVGGITVVSPSADPKAVAVQTINQLIAAVI